MPPKAVISKITQSSTIGSNGTLVPAYRVDFSVGNHGPFSLTFAQADFTVPNVQKALADFAASINTLSPAN